MSLCPALFQNRLYRRTIMAKPILTRKSKNFKDLSGQKFGRWTVLEYAGDSNCYSYFLCRCECGVEKTVLGTNLKRGISTSCGCYWAERMRKHGMTKSGACQSYYAMVTRCTDPNSIGWKYYGGRGIVVCERWSGKDGFLNFYADMGDRPTKKHTIDRIDSNGNYEPKNCRWSTTTEQHRNQKGNRIIEIDGVSMCLSAWAEKMGIPPHTIYNRIKAGWDERSAVLEPKTTRKNKKL